LRRRQVLQAPAEGLRIKEKCKMAKEKKVEQITDMEVDFAQWFTDVCTKAELVDYSGIKGLFILRPYGYAIWENIQNVLDAQFKATGHENVSMPMLIPESLLQREKDHVEGFAPECAWVTMGGSEKLPERLCVRPTSETLFCDHWSHVVHSWRDLPMLYNQWCSVLRWEKTTRPFLRGREFLWQEGHTLHATEEEARKETLQMLEIYANTCEKYLAMPVIRGNKTDKEKFAGAVNTYTIECMMHDRKALQSGTSHYFGDGFARAFDITFSDKENKLSYPHQTSWGMSTRIIGGIIMTHGDNNGLVLPPQIAPIQVIVLPIAAHKPGVTEKAEELVARLKDAGLRVKGDFSDNSPGWKFANWEMKGVPLRIEIGPKDMENGQCVAVRRDNREKTVIALEELEAKVPQLLGAVQQGLFDKAYQNLTENIRPAYSLEEARDIVAEKGGFVKTMWCGDLDCELKMKEVAGVSSRCIPFDQEHLGDVCPVCGRAAKKMVVWGVAY
jgi:prolyl-tRNA synthetase